MSASLAHAQVPVSRPAADPQPSARVAATTDAGTGSSLPADIIVTANRRAESVQRSALAIQAFSAETLRSAGVVQGADLQKLTQGLQVGIQGSTTQIYIRGVGDYSGNALANPGVAFNVDGVYVGRPEGVGSSFFDIARLEIVKGPQGTLYGRNASGGAINLITNSPTLDRVKGYVDVEGGSYNLYHVDGAINVPLSETVAVRVAVNRIKRDGYLTDGLGDDDQLAGRLKLLYKPSTDFSILLSVDGEQVRGKGGGFVYLPRRLGASPWEGTTSPAANAYLATYNPLILPGASDSFVHDNFINTSAQVDWNLGFATLTVIPAYRHSTIAYIDYPGSLQQSTGKADQYTGEVRLGNSTERLKWVVGFYYFNEKDPGAIFVNKGVGLLKANVVYNPSGVAYAGFGEATYSIVPGLRLTGGIRYTSERRRLNGDFFLYPTQAEDFLDIEHFFGDKTFNSVTWKAGAEYDVAPQSLLYFSASTGFKSGGITQTVPPDNIYRPEKVLAFELGSKNRFFDNMLQVNLEGFYWKYTDQQNAFLSFDALGNNNFTTINAGKADLYGVNVDVLFRPTPSDAFHVAFEYDHSKYASFNYQTPFFNYTPQSNGCINRGVTGGTFLPLITIDCAGFELPHAPRYSGSADYTHSFKLKTGATIDANVSGRLSSSTWLQIDFIQPERAPAFAILDASLTFRPESNRFSVTAYARNLNNGTEYTGGQQPSFSNGLFASSITSPRTFGAQVHVTF